MQHTDTYLKQQLAWPLMVKCPVDFTGDSPSFIPGSLGSWTRCDHNRITFCLGGAFGGARCDFRRSSFRYVWIAKMRKLILISNRTFLRDILFWKNN